jgi:hypothetical protein
MMMCMFKVLFISVFYTTIKMFVTKLEWIWVCAKQTVKDKKFQHSLTQALISTLLLSIQLHLYFNYLKNYYFCKIHSFLNDKMHTTNMHGFMKLIPSPWKLCMFTSVVPTITLQIIYSTRIRPLTEYQTYLRNTQRIQKINSPPSLHDTL